MMNTQSYTEGNGDSDIEETRFSHVIPNDQIDSSHNDEQALFSALSDNAGISVGEILGTGGMGKVFSAKLEHGIPSKNDDNPEAVIPSMRTLIQSTVPTFIPDGSVTPNQKSRAHKQTMRNAIEFLGTENREGSSSGEFALKLSTDENPMALKRSFHEGREMLKMQRSVEGLPRVFATLCAEVRGKHFNLIAMEKLNGMTIEEFMKQEHDIRLHMDVAALISRHCYQFWKFDNSTNRDIKPANLILSPEGRIRGFDLGLVTQPFNEDKTEMTADSDILGTIKYAAPEQLTKKYKISPKADVYSLGLTLARMFMGQHPYEQFPQYGEMENEAMFILAHLQNGELIEYLQKNLSMNVATIENPLMRQFVREELIPFIKEMIQEDPSDRPDMDQVSERFRRWSSFGHLDKDTFRESGTGDVHLRKISIGPDDDTFIGNTQKGEDPQSLHDAFEAGITVATKEYNFLETALKESDTPLDKTVIATAEELAEEAKKDAAEYGQPKKFSLKTIGGITAVGALVVSGIVSLMNKDDEKPTSPNHAPTPTKVEPSDMQKEPTILGEQFALQYKDDIAAGLKEAVLSKEWDTVDYPETQWQEPSIIETNDNEDMIIIADMELITRKDGNVLFPIPTDIAGQEHIKSMVVGFLDGKRIDDDRLTSDIVMSTPNKENPHINAFYNIRFEKMEAGRHLSVKVIHHINQPVYSEDSIDLHNTKAIVTRLIQDEKISEEEWNKIEKAFEDACNIIQDGDISGIHWNLARENNNHGDCGAKAGQLAKDLENLGFEAIVAEGSKLDTDLSEKIGNHAVVLLRISGGIIVLDPEHKTRNYIGPLTKPYTISTLGSSVDVYVKGQTKQPSDDGGFNLGHMWKVLYEESQGIRQSTRGSGDDRNSVHAIEEMLFEKEN